MRKKQAVACVIRFVSSQFDEQKRLDGQEDERKGCGVRMQAEDEKQRGEHLRQKRHGNPTALPERMLTILQGEGCGACCDDRNHGGKVRCAKKRRGIAQRQKRNRLNHAAHLLPKERQEKEHHGAQV